MNEIIDSIRSATLGPAVAARNLTVFPFLGKATSEPEILSASAALAAGLLRISEISVGGTVPRLLLENRAGSPVLLLDGEHLVGCKQNRVLNTSVLAPPTSTIELPVSCVEQGRWSYSKSEATLASAAMFSELRADKVRQVSRSMQMHRTPQADQGAIWAAIARKSARMGSDSPSVAMEGIYDKRSGDLEPYEYVSRPQEHQRGGVFAINGRIVGIELLATPGLWHDCSRQITAGYALDALDYDTPVHGRPHELDAREFIDRVCRLARKPFESVGLGEDVRLVDDGPQDSSGAAGSALVYESQLVHLCAFDLEAVDRPGDGARRDGRRTGLLREARHVF